MNRFWISDCHFNHANIIKYCGRTQFMTKGDLVKYNKFMKDYGECPKTFKISDESLDNMNKTLIKNWNARVKKDDVVYHDGDFCFKNSKGGKKGEGLPIKSIEIERMLNGKIIHIKGNHDKNNSTKTIIHNIKISHANHIINIVHNPEHCDYDVDINFTGHIHEKWKIKRFYSGHKFTDCINIGVDVWGFKPVTFDEIMSRYIKWKRLEDKGGKQKKKNS